MLFSLAGRVFPGRCRIVPATLRVRPLSSTASQSKSRLISPRGLTKIAAASVIGVGTFVFLQDARAGAQGLQQLKEKNPVGTTSDRPSSSLATLIRAYVVYSFCSVPALVDSAPALLETLSAIPGLKQITEAVVRATFFDQVRGIS